MSKRPSTPNLVQTLQAEAKRCAEHRASVSEKFEELIAALAAERGQLKDEIRVLREVLKDQEARQAGLIQQIGDAIEENARLSKEYIEVERQSSDIAMLLTASVQLNESLDRQEVLSAIYEVVSVLIGCEDLVLYRYDDENAALALVSSFGHEQGRPPTIPLGQGLVGHAAGAGEIYVRNGSSSKEALPEEADLTACIPLKVSGKLSGAIVLFQMLPHKPELMPIDHELFELLATQAANALYCAELRAREVESR